MAYPHKWSPISYKSSAGQRKDTGQRPMLYRWTTQPTNRASVASRGKKWSSSALIPASSLFRKCWISSCIHNVVPAFNPCLNKSLPHATRSHQHICSCITPKCGNPLDLLDLSQDCWLAWPHVRIDGRGWVSHAQKLDCHERDVLVHCLARIKMNTSLATLWIAGSSFCISNSCC